jgi:hypothetical protein
MIYGITLIILGLMAAPSLILSKKPNAKELLDKLTPFQGWIGLVFAFWGVWGIISAIMNLDVLTHWPIWWITWLASSVVEATLGFLLGYGMISKLILSKNPTAQEKGEQLLAKLAPLQGKLGLFGVIVGIWVVIASFLFLG